MRSLAGRYSIPANVRGFSPAHTSTRTLVGLQDRALIGVMIYSFARISAATAMSVTDYYTQGKRSFFRLHQKDGKYHVVPAHHVAQDFLDTYIAAANIEADCEDPLFRSSGQGRQTQSLQPVAMSRQTAIKMIKRRALAVGLPAEICSHTQRGTGITEYLRNGGSWRRPRRSLEMSRPRTTHFYDRTDNELSLNEIERIHT